MKVNVFPLHLIRWGNLGSKTLSGLSSNVMEQEPAASLGFYTKVHFLLLDEGVLGICSVFYFHLSTNVLKSPHMSPWETWVYLCCGLRSNVPLKIHILKSNCQCYALGCMAFGSWLDLMTGISTLQKQTAGIHCVPLSHENTMRSCHLWVRNWILTENQISLMLGIPGSSAARSKFLWSVSHPVFCIFL